MFANLSLRVWGEDVDVAINKQGSGSHGTIGSVAEGDVAVSLPHQMHRQETLSDFFLVLVDYPQMNHRVPGFDYFFKFEIIRREYGVKILRCRESSEIMVSQGVLGQIIELHNDLSLQQWSGLGRGEIQKFEKLSRNDFDLDPIRHQILRVVHRHLVMGIREAVVLQDVPGPPVLLEEGVIHLHRKSIRLEIQRQHLASRCPEILKNDTCLYVFKRTMKLTIGM